MRCRELLQVDINFVIKPYSAVHGATAFGSTDFISCCIRRARVRAHTHARAHTLTAFLPGGCGAVPVRYEYFERYPIPHLDADL